MTTPNVIETLRGAMSAHQSGDLTSAESLYREVIEADPRQTDALHYLGLILQQRGSVRDAIGLLKQAVEIRADDPACWNNLGNMLSETKRSLEAVGAYQEAVRLKPDHVNAIYNLGLVLLDTGDSQAAVKSIRRGLELEPNDAEMWNSLGEALTRAQSFDEALDAFQTAYRLAPDFAEACNNLGLAFLDRGESQTAIDHFHEALRLSPGMPEALANLARSRRFTVEDRDQLDVMARVLRSGSIDERGRALLHFSLGKVYDDCGEYDRAFEHYTSGNDLKAQQNRFDSQRHTDLVTRTVAAFSAESLGQFRGLGSDDKSPVFIIGMPRSGSSLVEQIVASHPNAVGVGEFGYLTELCHRLSSELATENDYPECVAAIDRAAATRLSQGYLDALRKGAKGAERVTDKMLTNFLYLGIIDVLFPKAKVIHCRRDARDVCLSNYFQLFGAGQFYSYGLDSIATYYRDYLRLMTHWSEVLTIEVNDVVYEELVHDQETVSRSLIDYCGLPWDDTCLSFHQTRRSVHTASNWQVRQRVYRGSVGRWRNYTKHLPESILSLG